MIQKFREAKWFVLIAALVAAVLFVIFSPKIALEKRLLSSGKHYEELREWKDAADEFERCVHYAPQSQAGVEAARLGGGIALYELKDYQKAIFFFRHIVRNSQKTVEVRWAQQKLAEIYYEKLNDYAQAVVEYQRLLEANPSGDDASDYKLRLGRSYYFMGNFDQAIAEASEFLASRSGDAKTFDILMLKGDALLAQKKLDEAIATYDSVAKEFADRPEFYQAKLNKSLALEEKKDWDGAIKELQEIRDKYPHPDVIDLKIRSIQRRKAKKRDT
jgi:tetratricopeptide (TPR) repeat protein